MNPLYIKNRTMTEDKVKMSPTLEKMMEFLKSDVSMYIQKEPIIGLSELMIKDRLNKISLIHLIANNPGKIVREPILPILKIHDDFLSETHLNTIINEAPVFAYVKSEKSRNLQIALSASALGLSRHQDVYSNTGYCSSFGGTRHPFSYRCMPCEIGDNYAQEAAAKNYDDRHITGLEKRNKQRRGAKGKASTLIMMLNSNLEKIARIRKCY